MILIKKEDGIERIEGSANSRGSSFWTVFFEILIKKRVNTSKKIRPTEMLVLLLWLE